MSGSAPLKNKKIVLVGSSCGGWIAARLALNIKNIIGLDTGCVWGGSLTALRLEDMKIFSVQKK